MNDKNKIVWIFNHYGSTPQMPGLSRHHDLAKELANRGYKVSIFTSNFEHYTLSDVKDVKNNQFIIEENDGINYYWIRSDVKYRGNTPKRLLNWFDYAYKIFRLDYKKLEEPDFIIGSSPHLFAAFSAYLIAKKYKRTSYILEIRDIYPETLLSLGWSKLHPFVVLLSIIEQFLYKKADHIFVLPSLTHKHIIKTIGNQAINKISWIPNAVNSEIQTNTIISNEQIFSLLIRPEKKIVYLGSFGSVYPLDNLIKAAYLLNSERKDTIFIFIGYGPLELNLKKLVSELKLENVYFPGIIPKNEVQSVLKKCDILYNTVRDSPLYRFGTNITKMRDYFLSRVPVLSATNIEDDLVRLSGAGFLANPNDPRDIANKISIILDLTDDGKSSIGKKANEYLLSNFSLATVCTKIESVFFELENKKSGKSDCLTSQ
jgi:glycosyltransferase involved in cell wall biosynthesis